MSKPSKIKENAQYGDMGREMVINLIRKNQLKSLLFQFNYFYQLVPLVVLVILVEFQEVVGLDPLH